MRENRKEVWSISFSLVSFSIRSTKETDTTVERGVLFSAKTKNIPRVLLKGKVS